MSQQIQCPHCGQAYALTDEQVPQYAGQTITCTRCQKPFTVSMPSAAQQPVMLQPQETMTSQPSQQSPQQAQAPTPTSPFPPAQSAPVSYAQGNYYRSTQTSGICIASLVLGLAGLIVPLAGLLGAILGIVGLKQTRQTNAGGRGLAIGGIVSGTITTLLWGACVGMIYVRVPAAMRQIRTAQMQQVNTIKCSTNLRQIGQAILLYSNDNRGAYPPNLATLLTTQDISAEVFICPDTTDTPAPGSTPQAQAAALNGHHLSYIYLGAGMNNTAGAQTVVAYEPLTNHTTGCNFLWGDGHVTFETKSRAKRYIDQLNAGQNPPSLSNTARP